MMELRDVPDSSILSSSSFATQNRIQNGIPLLLISFRSQSNSFRKHSSNVNSHPESLLQSVQYSEYPEHHSYQSNIYHHIRNPASENVHEHNSVKIIKSWPEDTFYTLFAATFTFVGVLIAVVWIIIWLRNNIWRRREISTKTSNIKEHFTKMDENKDKLREASKVNTCLQITITDTESHDLLVEDTLTAENDIARDKITSRHMNMRQLETSQQTIKQNCQEKKINKKTRKQIIKTENVIIVNVGEKDGECSFSRLKLRKNKHVDAEVEEIRAKDSDQTLASIKNEMHSREQMLDQKLEDNFEKHSEISYECDKDSSNNSDTSSSFTFIPPPTPSSISSSVISSAVNITPNTIMGSFNSACEVSQQFTFSPKLVNEYKSEKSSDNQKIVGIGSKTANSYYRFPDVDTFTPPSIQYDEKPSKRISLIYPCISPKHLKQNDASNYLVQQVDQTTFNNIHEITEQSNHLAQNSACLSDRASRRARLKSISLDSEGARLVEENLSSGIPVEELVERAANQAHYSSAENQSQPTEMAASSSSASCRKQRNILNLKLNLNDKDKTLPVDEEYRLNDFFFEYYDYDDEEDTEGRVKLNRGAAYTEKHPNQFSQRLQPKTPTLNLTREKANSLDSEQYLNYLLPTTNQTLYGPEKEEQELSSKSSTTSIRVSSLSVPTTPKRQFHRLPHQQQLVFGKSKQNGNINDNCSVVSNSPSSDRYLLSGFKHRLCSFDEKTCVYNNQMVTEAESLSSSIRILSNDQSVTNLRSRQVFSSSFTDRQLKTISIDNPNKNRSSILQRRGSNHSLTLNLEASSTLNKGLSASNFSLGNHKGSYHNLVSSSSNLNHHQSDQQSSHQQRPLNVKTKKNLLQRRGSNTSLVLNLQGSTNSLNRYNSHNSLNIHNQPNNRPLKKGLIERRNSNTSLTLFNEQNPALSVSNCNLPGSNCSLNSMVTYHTQNDGLMLEEDEHQVASNNNQSNYCGRVDSNATNESHLSLSCAQHSSRRKFLSSDSIHNIARSRALCCCQQEVSNVKNLRISHNRDIDDSCSGEYNLLKKGAGGYVLHDQYNKELCTKLLKNYFILYFQIIAYLFNP
ncbi:uncharacterized protein LOC120428293 isoform X1 [Culex pipiens pallens]|uniref:uncharacterized protein LOC120428293 isoform X1 n=1 Tax=Culex pipiens pallens TaxID=42434 RepID=UPI0022AA62AD|nr:uncharacterized protein LOC120428293 isoform X1 [Culex pipiens pallens]XP_039449224.2 uncharacterized protein LOC120428293 isoform X1 [Culex pipiens pallens]XP_039449232.2 uncharacterized protein LOC120428293 isoform X1 [Culex pipiens pallens]XP_052567566.1 uncharacterized protein LOC120428293 isoform X1 [Culex pipiens pallens]